MKVTAKQFEEFKAEFKKWQEKFGLNGYQVYFKHCQLDNDFAQISRTQNSMVATVSLANSVEGDDAKFLDVKNSARHEAVHLLLSKLSDCASCRYVTEDGIYEAEEEAVNRIMSVL